MGPTCARLICQLLEINGGRLILDGLGEALPDGPEFGRTPTIIKGGRIEEGSMDTLYHLRKRDLSWWTSKAVAALLASLALDDVTRFQIDQYLDEIAGGDFILDCEVFHRGCPFNSVPSREGKDCPRRVIAFDGEFQGVMPIGTIKERNGVASLWFDAVALVLLPR